MGDIKKDTKAFERLSALFDDGIFTEIDAFAMSKDHQVEVVAGYGTVGGHCVYAFSQDVSVDSGAISVSQCKKIKKVYDLANKTGCPIIGIYDSNGLKLTEGFEALGEYGEILKASTSVSGVIPQISIIAGSCLGTSALMANMADVVVALEGADFYVTTPSDVTVSDSAKKGTVDILAKDFDEAVKEVSKVISLLPSNNLDAIPLYDFAEPVAEISPEISGVELISAVADKDSVVEFKSEYAKKVVTALGTIIGSTVGFMAIATNEVCPACCYKAEAFVKLCDAYNIPIVTFVDASGTKKEVENQLLSALTRLTVAVSTATCPKISVITKNAVGVSYIALAGKGANADLAYAWDSAVLSPIDVEAAVAFMFNDRLAKGESREDLANEYKESLASPLTAASCGAIDDVFSPEETREKLISAINILASKRETTIPRKHSVK